MPAIDKKTFLAAFANKTIDANLPSRPLKDALSAVGGSVADLKKIAGPDGRIKSSAEMNKLFGLLDGFDGKKDRKIDLGSKAAPTAVAGLNEALNAEAAANLKFAIYNPGTTAAAPQRQKTLVDALVVDKADRKPTVSLAVPGKSQFTWGAENGLNKEQANHACFDTASWQTNEFLTRTFGKKAPQLDVHQSAIQVAYAEDASGRVAVDPMQQEIGRDYLDRMLDKGFPVMVGVSVWKDRINNDRLTEHFVTISGRGYDESGRLFYEFKDPGLGGSTQRFFVDAKTEVLFRPGEKQVGDVRTVRNMDYELTQVRTYKGIE